MSLSDGRSSGANGPHFHISGFSGSMDVYPARRGTVGEEHVAEGGKERPEVVWKHLSHTEKDGCETGWREKIKHLLLSI